MFLHDTAGLENQTGANATFILSHLDKILIVNEMGDVLNLGFPIVRSPIRCGLASRQSLASHEILKTLKPIYILFTKRLAGDDSHFQASHDRVECEVGEIGLKSYRKTKLNSTTAFALTTVPTICTRSALS